MTHFVEAAAYIRHDRELANVYVKWEQDTDKHVMPPDRVSNAIGNASLMRFDTLKDAARFLAARNAAIGNMTVIL